MFQSLSQGALIYILHKNEMTVDTGRIVSVNTHLPQYNPAQPQAMLNGMVTDLTISVGNETLPVAGVPATASVANFSDKGLFISEDKNLIVSEVISIRDNHQRIVDGYEPSREMVSKCESLLLTLNPEKQKEVQNAKEMAELRGQISELKNMLSAVLGTKSKEEQ